MLARLFRGNLGLLLVVFLVLCPQVRQAEKPEQLSPQSDGAASAIRLSAREMGSLLQLPPEEQLISNLMLTSTALAAWLLTRAYVWYRDRRDRELERKTRSQKQKHQARKRRIACAAVWIVAALALFTSYKWLAGGWVTWSTPSTVKDAVIEPQRAFYHPLKPSAAFVEKLEHRGGWGNAADNDPDWLADALKEENVTTTKLLVLLSLLCSLAALNVGVTLISALPKAAVGTEGLSHLETDHH